MKNYPFLKTLLLLTGILVIAVACGKGGGGGGGGGDSGSGSAAVSENGSDEASPQNLGEEVTTDGEELKIQPRVIEGTTNGAPVDCAGVEIAPGSVSVSYSVSAYPIAVKILFKNESKTTVSVTSIQTTYATVGAESVISTDIPKSFALVPGGQRSGAVTFAAPPSGVSSPALAIFQFQCASSQTAMVRKSDLGISVATIQEFVDIPVSAKW